MRRTPVFLLLAIAACGALWASAKIPSKVVYIPFADARPMLEAEADALPEGLKGQPLDKLQVLWPGWVQRRDAEIRQRLAQGEEDTIVNFLLFGASFTRQPRVNPSHWEGSQGAPGKEQIAEFQRLIFARVADLTAAAAHPGENERLRFVAGVLSRKGYNLEKEEGRQQAALYLRESLARVLKEGAGYAGVLRAARSLGDPTEEFVRRSTLFHARGLSLDTAWPVDYALDNSLAALKAKGMLKDKSVQRVAIVGPGLDFTDKQEGYDFYPQQTIQPFAVMDSLVRLGLAQPDRLSVTTLDLSRRVNEHLAHARARAQAGHSYVLQFVLDPEAKWTQPAAHFWEHLGDQIGSPVQPVPAPTALAGLKVRAVRIPPQVVERITPVDLDIVLQRLNLADPARFDLIIATNILVYYDTFHQTLALSNLTHMLKPGGLLLSNNVVLELPNSLTHNVGYQTTVYSPRPDDGDHIVWYRRAPEVR